MKILFSLTLWHQSKPLDVSRHLNIRIHDTYAHEALRPVGFITMQKFEEIQFSMVRLSKGKEDK